MAIDTTQKILDSLERLEEHVENGFSQVRDEFVKIDNRFARVNEQFARVDDEFAKVRDEMQGGFSLVHERIAQSEQSIKHILETVIELHDSLDKRVEKLENEINTSHSH